MREFGWRCYYGNASRLDLLEEAGMNEAKLLFFPSMTPLPPLRLQN